MYWVYAVIFQWCVCYSTFNCRTVEHDAQRRWMQGLVFGYCCSCTVLDCYQSLNWFLAGVLSVPRVSQYFITSEILQATISDICPWSTTTTHTHTHMDTHGHTAAHTDRLIFNGIIYFPPDPLKQVHEHVSAVTYRCCLLHIQAEPVIRKSDKSSFTHERMESSHSADWTHDATEYKYRQPGKNINICSVTMSIICDI